MNQTIKFVPVVLTDDLGDREIRRLKKELRDAELMNTVLALITLFLAIAIRF